MKAAQDMAQTLRDDVRVQRKEVDKLTTKQSSDDAPHSDGSRIRYQSS